MNRRKTICLLTAMPEALHCRRISKGIFEQCNKYGYNVAVFATTSNLLFYIRDHADGEKNIYTLPNYALFDGIIIDTVTLVEDLTGEVMDTVYRNIKAQTDVPTVCIGVPYKELDTISSSNEEILREMCRHVVLGHGKKDILLMTGMKENSESDERLGIFVDELSKLGVEIDDDHKVYGDFWYNSGISVADEMINGTRPMPEAVIAANDYMALGVIEELTAHGIRIPEDIIVIGFEASNEAMLADTTLSSYESNFAKAAADAVDHLRRLIEPEAEVIPYVDDIASKFHPGMSCGCEPEIMRSAKIFRDSLYLILRNFNSKTLLENIDIGYLMESYAYEELTGSSSPEECIRNIFLKTYLLSPYVNFSLCLREDWLSYDKTLKVGYPDRMKIVVANSSAEDGTMIQNENEAVVFDTSLMLPGMQSFTEKPSVFYFAPVHFSDNTLGYAVLQRELSDEHLINLVFRNWLRFVNNSLEMVRARNRYVVLSVYDNMTGLFNRRGMYERFEEMLRSADTGDKLFACVIDMDGLKYINDTFGHSEGDLGIRTISRAVKQTTKENEICVRAGGDEFYIIGIGDYPENECEERCSRFEAVLAELSRKMKSEYPISASIGCSLSASGSFDLEDTLSDADEEMYRFKMRRKRHRQ